MRFLILILCSFIFFEAFSQSKTPGPNTEENILRVYRQQLDALYQTRALSNREIEEYMKDNAGSLSSIPQFADVLGKLYAEEKETAFLLYFFSNDTLFRYLLEPGIIIEKDFLKISRSDLLNLTSSLFQALDIEKISANRAPKHRGGHATSTDTLSSGNYNLDSIITKATTILFPRTFSKKYCNLVILPALNIGTFPFSMLRPYGDGSVLLDHCSYSVAPGLADLVVGRTKIAMNSGFKHGDKLQFTFERPLFVCNPIYPTNTSFEFPELPGANKEVQSVIPFAKTYTLLEGENASRSEVMLRLRNCDVAYFATHGIASETKPMDSSFLVLSGNKTPFLTAQDVVNMRDSTRVGNLSFPEMVILSACQTGLGKSMEAGVAGLARSFLMAGANHVMMSLWNVDDDATAYLMNRFVYYLTVPGLYLPAEPLRLATLDTREKFGSPSKWASFSVFGMVY